MSNEHLPQQLLAAFALSQTEPSLAQQALRAFVGACGSRAASGMGAAAPRLLRELAAVHRREQARLLCRASALRCRSSCARGSTHETSARVHSRWRADCTEELRACRQDGVEADYLLQECHLRRREAWRSATEIAQGALALGAGAAGLHRLALAALSEGDPQLATDALLGALPELPMWVHDREACVRALEVLAIACEANGDLDAARRHRRAAGEIGSSRA